MIKLFRQFNAWFRNLVLDDVDKEYNVYIPHHKNHNSRENPVDRIEKRFDDQKKSIG